MKIETHKERSLKTYGVEAQDIHNWIDGLFDHERFQHYLQTGVLAEGFNPYDHRVHRHCMDVEDECVEEFKDTYSEEVVRGVFEQHIRDDYGGYYPNRDDYDDEAFHDKYHSS